RLDQYQFAVEHDATAADAVFVGERADVENALAAGDLAADHPIERAAVAELLGALGHHAGGVDVLGLEAAFLFLFELLLDPVFEIRDRVVADAQLDEMKRHYRFVHPSVSDFCLHTSVSSILACSGTNHYR